MLTTENDHSVLELTVPVENVYSELDLKCLNRTDLAKLQRNDKSLNSLYDSVVTDSHSVDNGICFMIQKMCWLENAGIT